MGEYSTDKAINHHKSLAILQDGGQPYPVHVQIIPSDYCNQDCNFCAYRSSNYDANPLFKIIEPDGTVNHNPKRIIPWPKLQSIVHDCKEMGVRAIQLTGGGEPTLYPQFPQLLNLIIDSGIEFAIVTNGVLAGRSSHHRMAEATWLRFSIDCGNAKTYSRIRSVPEAEFSLVFKNIRTLVNAPNRKAVIGVGFVITEDNYNEVVECAHLCKEAGVDNLRISALFQSDHTHYFEKFLPVAQEQLQKVQELATPEFRIFNNFTSRYNDLAQRRPDYSFCPVMHFTTYIAGDQHVYTCCVNSYNLRGDIGSLETQGFKELWDSHHKKKMFDGFDAQGCPLCMFNDKNKSIHKILELPKSHENFV